MKILRRNYTEFGCRKFELAFKTGLRADKESSSDRITFEIVLKDLDAIIEKLKAWNNLNKIGIKIHF